MPLKPVFQVKNGHFHTYNIETPRGEVAKHFRGGWQSRHQVTVQALTPYDRIVEELRLAEHR